MEIPKILNTGVFLFLLRGPNLKGEEQQARKGYEVIPGQFIIGISGIYDISNEPN